MELVVDPIIFRNQFAGGISRLYSEILPRMCTIDPALQITLLVGGPFLQAMPAHPQITNLYVPPVERLLRPGRLWWRVAPQVRRYMQMQRIGATQGKIWQSTYFTSPGNWQGTTVVLVADLIYALFPDFFNSSYHKWFLGEQRRCIEKADAAICISRTTQTDVQRLYGISHAKAHVALLACSAEFRPLARQEILQRPTSQPFLLYVGMRSGYKNFKLLLDAYIRWQARNSVDLVVVGSPWSQEEQRLLAALDTKQNVHILTGLDDRDLCVLYNQAAAFVYPSLYEGFGIPLLEAMACGCPIVASCIPSSVEIAGECPVYFDPTSEYDLQRALDEVMTEGRTGNRVVDGQRVAAQYNWDITAQSVLNVYKSLE
jgi:glycosyltransferase involved in cell wall biosynthesis